MLGSSISLCFSLSLHRMESLELAPLFLCRSSAKSAHDKRNSGVGRQLRLDSLLKRTSRNSSFRLRSSISGGNRSSRDGHSGFEDEGQEHKRERARVLTKQTDASGSLIGFHLIPNSGIISFCF